MYILSHFYSFHMLKTYVNSYIYIYIYIYIECKINYAASCLEIWISSPQQPLYNSQTCLIKDVRPSFTVFHQVELSSSHNLT